MRDDRIIAATPNIAIGTNQATSETTNAPVTVLEPRAVTEIDFETKEQEDWGIGDIKASQFWNQLDVAPRVGVIDVGFALHDDLAFGQAPGGTLHDHGNHVAGIICAKHNAFGVRGVLPDCQILAKTGDFLPLVTEGDNVQSFLLLFSQILLSMDDFVNDRDEVRAFNASLGYNWRSNFDINPTDEENFQIRANIQNQAIFLLPVLQAAQERNILIFSAAGNDSDLNNARDAVFASPFNWAARMACENLGNCSGVIVEAHDKAGNRASFSNINGDLSCPGVDIISTVSSARNTYAKMSGTSMALPYCTGGYVMFSILRPEYSSQEALNCFKESGPRQPHGTPKMDLEAALSHCQQR